MINPPIYRALAFSIVIHISLFVAAFFIIKPFDTHKKIQPYIVSLVEDMKYSVAAQSGGSPDKLVKTAEPTASQPPPPSQPPSTQKADKSMTQKDNIIKERITALQAKKKIEKIVALRKVIDIEGQRNLTGGSQKPLDKVTSSGAASSAGSDYYSMIVKKIRQEWIFPENLDRNLEAIVSIKIAKDGSIKIDKIEKSSGNPVFDRYALRAINKASPLPPPPHEMEVGVRFYP